MVKVCFTLKQWHTIFPGIWLSGKRLSEKVTYRETSVNHSNTLMSLDSKQWKKDLLLLWNSCPQPFSMHLHWKPFKRNQIHSYVDRVSDDERVNFTASSTFNISKVFISPMLKLPQYHLCNSFTQFSTTMTTTTTAITRDRQRCMTNSDLLMFATGYDAIHAVESSRRHKQYVGCVHCDTVASQLTRAPFWHVNNRSLQQLQHTLHEQDTKHDFTRGSSTATI